eukprot:969428-Pyramimonas_sp.AAC.1
MSPTFHFILRPRATPLTHPTVHNSLLTVYLTLGSELAHVPYVPLHPAAQSPPFDSSDGRQHPPDPCTKPWGGNSRRRLSCN